MTKKVVAGVVTRFVYNMEDRLSQVWSGEAGSGDLIAEYYYDPFGRRLWKQVGAARTVFHYSDQGLIAEYDGAGNEVRAYGYKPGSQWTTDPLFMKTGGRYYFYHNDHLGTPQKMTDVSGAVVWSAKPESFGEATVEVATVENNLRFPGQYYDNETGLHYNLNRYYLPDTGRYGSADPVGLQGGINFYSYCLNDPLNLTDTMGLIWVTVDHDRPDTKNWTKFVLNWILNYPSHGDDPHFPGDDPKEYERLERYVIQEWQHDPDNPSRDNEHGLGARRIITQTYKQKPPPLPDELWDEDTTHYWKPQVPDRTYEEFPDAKIENDPSYVSGNKKTPSLFEICNF
ncbi:MAG: RHS repeat-associated core domain-containing protein [Desulfosalsimonadaceae bacterium]